MADSRSPRDGKFIEEIGTYQPLKKDEQFQAESRARQVLAQQRRPAKRHRRQLYQESRPRQRRRRGLSSSLSWVMQAFLEYVVKGLVQHPDEVTVTPVEREGTTIYELRLHPEDVGKMIGRQGMTINAIRSCCWPAAPRKGCAAASEIVEEQAGA